MGNDNLNCVVLNQNRQPASLHFAASLIWFSVVHKLRSFTNLKVRTTGSIQAKHIPAVRTLSRSHNNQLLSTVCFNWLTDALLPFCSWRCSVANYANKHRWFEVTIIWLPIYLYTERQNENWGVSRIQTRHCRCLQRWKWLLNSK